MTLHAPRRGTRRSWHRGDSGASLIEFAILMPFLLLLLLGIVEFGWLFGQYNDVRHGAREGARLAAVNAGDNTFLDTQTCSSMDLTSPATVSFGAGGGNIGDTGTVAVVASPNSLSGFGPITALLPVTLTSAIEFRLEQPASSWSSHGPISC